MAGNCCGTFEVQNRYDADGIRVAQTVSGQETRILIDTVQSYAQVLLEYTPAGVIKVSYVHGLDLISQNHPVDTGKSFYHVDGLGSTRALSDGSGLVTDLYIYDAFGRTIGQEGSTGNVYLFAGEQRDVNLAIDYLRARYYHVPAGRLLGRDAWVGILRRPMTLHRFSYAGNNPVNFTDPSGMQFSLPETMAGLAARATFGQIVNAIYLPVFLRGSALVASVLLMQPGFQVRSSGLELIANNFDVGFDVYQDGNEMIALAANFSEVGAKIVDYGLIVLDIVQIMRSPLRLASGFTGRTIDAGAAARYEFAVDQVENAAQTLRALAGHGNIYQVNMIRRTLPNLSELIANMNQLFWDVFGVAIQE